MQVGDLVRFKEENRIAQGDADPRMLYPHKFEVGIVIGNAPGWRPTVTMAVMFPSRTDEFLVGLMEVISSANR